MTAKVKLSKSQLEQRKEARNAAVISRRLNQLKRLQTEVRQVVEKLVEAGADISRLAAAVAEVPEGQGEDQSAQAICSAAGAALRQCAKAKKREMKIV